jgi:translocation and assembly module TamA
MMRRLALAWLLLASSVAPAWAAEAADLPAPAASAPVQAAYALEIDAPEALRKLLFAYLDLARFQNASDAEAITDAELDRLLAAAPAQARALLETEGYFSAQVSARRLGANQGLPRLRVEVKAGPRIVVEQWTLDALGELQLLIEANDALATATFEGLRRRWPLQTGAPFRQAAWAAAKSETLARVRANGYPSATWLDTDAAVDVARATATVRATLSSGPLFRLGELRIEGLQRYAESSVRNVAEFGPGAPHSEQSLLDFQERLIKSGLFEGVTVEVEPDPAQAAAAPVRVRVRELPLQQVTVGVGYSDNTGQRVTLEHMHRRPFGLNAIAKNKVEYGRDVRSWSGELTSHTLPGLYRNLLAGSYEKLEVAADLRTSWRWRAGRVYDSTRIERIVFGEWLGSELLNAAGRAQADAASLNVGGVWRELDSIALPTDGLTASGQIGGGWSHSNVASAGFFSRVTLRVTGYRPLGWGWYGNGHVELGHLGAAQDTGLPDPLLFRAGGDDSVRGYGYRTLGPVKNGVLTSGRALLTASAEVARPIAQSMPSLWWAAFVDAGNAADRFNTLDPAVGYGLGLRWRSPVGPLRIDWAYGVEVGKARLHLSVGIAL